jgi:hypothetical protein
MGKASITGRTAEIIMDPGKKTICMESVFTFMLMVSPMKANTLMIRRLDLVSTIGKMAESTKAGGTMENNTESEYSLMPIKRKSNMVSGKMESVSLGLTPMLLIK